MNILFLSTWHPYPPDNGSKLRVYHLTHALGQAHAVTLLAFALALPVNSAPLREWCKHIATVPIDPFVANRTSTLHMFLSLAPVATRALPSMQHLVTHTLRTQPFDAVIASTEVTAAYALRTPAATAKILEEHNSLTRWMHERSSEQTSPIQKLRCWVSWQKTRLYEARLFNRFDLVTMVSAQDRAVCLAELPGYRGPVEVVPNGVDCEHNRPGLGHPKPNMLVFNGSLTYSANYDAMRWFLAAIYPLVKAQLPGVSLVITGATAGIDLAGLALDASVHLTGFVDDVRVPVAEAAVCVAPIRHGGGTRLKILEAMALGTPVVATTKGAEGLDVADGEHLLLADTPAAFAQATLALLADAGQRVRLAAAARRLVEGRYDWDAIGRRFTALVEETASTRRPLSCNGF